MNIHDLVADINEQILESDLKPLKDFPIYETAKKALEGTGLDINDFYQVDKGIHPYIYWKPPVFFPFMTVFEEDDLFNHYIKTIQYRNENKDDIEKLLTCAGTGTVVTLNSVYFDIPEEKRYELFLDTYVNIDRGHTHIKPEIYKDVFNHKPEGLYEELPEIITIYRGEGTKSTSYKESYSWTTSYETACFFAVRLSATGKVYKAQVRKEDIIAYTNERDENEIIVFPESLFNIEDLDIPCPVKVFETLTNEGYIEEYHLYKNTFIKNKNFVNPHGIHGITHAYRVLFHCLNLSRIYHLSDIDRGILANAACYHDIGRSNDEEDEQHGIASWKKYQTKISKKRPLFAVSVVPIMKEQGYVEEGDFIPYLLERENKNIVRFLIQNHCIEDNEAKVLLDNDKKIKDKERAWKLYCIFKDADGLDRVRLDAHLSEVNIKYFRHPDTYKYLIFAKVLHDTIVRQI